MKGIILLILAIILIMIAVLVGFRNSDVVTINYLIAQLDMRISTFMVMCIIIGFFLGFITILTKYLALKVRFASMKRRLEKLAIDKTA
ncbi:MAG: putative membrane protein [Alphaproteobacteria bacterium]|jgi:putative membrane protein